MSAANAPSKLLVKDGVIVNHDGIQRGDIFIEGDHIKQIGPNIIPTEDMQIIDAKGHYVFPGGVDPDCRLVDSSQGIPVADDFKQGSLASLSGGTTTIVNQVPVCPGGSITQAYDKQRSLMDAECHCDFTLSLAVPSYSTDVAEEMKSLAKSKKVAAFTFRFCSLSSNHSTTGGLDDDGLTEALKTCANIGVLPSVVASGNAAVLNKIADELNGGGPTVPEDCLRGAPERFEGDTVTRVALLASEISCPVFFNCVHSPAALKALVEQRRNAIVFGGTSIAAIGSVLAGCTVSHMDWSTAASCVTDPPIRPEIKVARQLLKHVASGDILTVGSAHRAIATGVRAGIGMTDYRRIPVGQATASGRLGVLWKVGVEDEALMDPCTFVAATSSNAARLFNIYPRKGRIAEGSDADLVIWRPESLTDHSKHIPIGVEDPFKGLNLAACRPEWVILRGQVVVDNGSPVETSTQRGKFVPVTGFGELAFGRVKTLKSIAEKSIVPVRREAYSGPVVALNGLRDCETPPREGHFYRKEDYDNAPKESLPPGQRVIHTCVKTAQPPGGESRPLWWNN